MGAVRTFAKRMLPPMLVQRLRLTRLGVGGRLDPVRRQYGLDSGQPIDRYYIEKFLYAHRHNICGQVLEVQNDNYTRRFGGDRVTHSVIVDIDAHNPRATLIADLTQPDQFPADTFDCIILTQVLQQIYDVQAAVKTLYRTLKPGGILLATLPNIALIDRYAYDRERLFWRFTSLSARRLFTDAFASANVEVNAHGNVLVATAFLHGIVVEELSPSVFEHLDPDYEVSITVRAAKAMQKGSIS